jgi:hypothetical protein
MKSTGIIQRLAELYQYKPSKKKKSPDFRVTLEAVAPTFILLTSGVTVSILVLAMEICIYRKVHRLQSRASNR